jgi:hypothetical protein
MDYDMKQRFKKMITVTLAENRKGNIIIYYASFRAIDSLSYMLTNMVLSPKFNAVSHE